MEKLGALEMHVLRHAQSEVMRDIEVRRPFLRMRVVRILRESRSDGACRTGAANHFARRINRLAPGITRLNARSAMSYGSGKRCLQGVVTRMRVGDDQVLYAEAADHVARAVELRVWRKLRAGPRICVRIAVAWQLLSRRAYVTCICRQVTELA